MKRDFLRLLDLSTEEIEGIWNRALAYKKGGGTAKPLRDLNVGLVFEKPSTRTRISFEVAVLRSGGHPLFVNARDTQMTRNEPLKDTARVLSRYLDALVVRTFSQKTLDELAVQARIPVVNALSDLYHPAQILSDLFTVWEKKKTLANLKIAWIGDGNNVAHSWMEAATRFPFYLSLACPPGFEPREEVWKAVRKDGKAQISLTSDPREAIRGAQVVNTDVWASMGQEDQAAERIRFFKAYQVNQDLMAGAHPEALFLHCLPAHRGEEVTEEVLEGPRSAVFDQAENKLYVHQALLEFILKGTMA